MKKLSTLNKIIDTAIVIHLTHPYYTSALNEPNEVKPIISKAMKEKKPTIVEAYVDPFEPPMPPKVEAQLFAI